MSMRTLALVFLLLLPSALRADDDAVATVSEDLKKIIDVFLILDNQAADPVSPDQAIYEGAIPGMLRTLDPHSNFYDPKAYAKMREDQRGQNRYGSAHRETGAFGSVGEERAAL